MPIIEVEHLTKEYRLGTLTSLRDSLTNLGRRLTGRPPVERERFKALDDVNFTVEEGEVVGIIGHNGAGKSTLLKILAKVTTPTRGRVVVNGSVAPLIEVGAGINPELTGRENIYLNASILGIPKKVIRRKIDEIIEFSELEQFIDTPVKRYSSGMQVKLGFAIATSLDAEILIIDEVLAVGDLAFQRKCFDRMEELIKRQGKTVLLVSHNIRQIERLCNRVLLLKNGKVISDGNANSVCTIYYEMSDNEILRHTKQKRKALNAKNEMTTGEAQLIDAALLDTNNKKIESLKYSSDLILQLKYSISSPIKNAVFGIGIHTTDFLYLATDHSKRYIKIPILDPGTYTILCKIESFPLLPGVYSIRAGIAADPASRTVYYSENILNFRVLPESEYNRAWNEGFVPIRTEWKIVKPTFQ